MREQLLYPHTTRQMSDRKLEDVLPQVNLQNLLTRVDGFDTEVPWENVLSLGEQQRLALARLLITRPSFTILDEATSALDLKNQGNLDQQLQQTKTTFKCLKIHYMENVVTTRLYLVSFTLEIVKAAIIGNAELASVLEVTVLPNWCEEEFSQNLPKIADILCKYPLQGEWGWGSLIVQKAEKTLIGHVMVKIIPDDTGSPTGSLEIGYYIVPSYRQQGYASEATKAMVDWAFCQPGVQKVTAGCAPDNIGSKRVLEKIGLQLIESRDNVLIWELQKTDIVQ